MSRARWNLLGDLAFDDMMLVVETVSVVREEWPDLDPREVERALEGLLGELEAAGLVRAFIVDDGDPEASLATSPRIGVVEALVEARAQGRERRPPRHWVALTRAGWDAVRDPPDDVRAMWGWPPGFAPDRRSDARTSDC